MLCIWDCSDSSTFPVIVSNIFRDVDDAIRARDGYNFGGQSLRVEIPSSRGSKRRPDYGPPGI